MRRIVPCEPTAQVGMSNRPPRLLSLQAEQAADPAAELAAGLQRARAQVSPKYFYDELGSHLFKAITALAEYTPTRTEAAIVRAHGAGIARAIRERIGDGASLIDLGAGDCLKAEGWFDALRPARYVAVDISQDFLRGALESLQRRHPAIEMVGVGLDFSRRLALPDELCGPRALVFYPGSSIGNFDPDQALGLLSQARALAPQGGLLIGVDLVKPVEVLEAAYDDALGVTAAFNLNLLRHVNRLLGSDFDVCDWRHVAFFDPAGSRIEMHLEARRALTARWPGGDRRFSAGERVHTENSYKWRPADFEALLRDAGFRHVQRWCDEREWFATFLATG